MRVFSFPDEAGLRKCLSQNGRGGARTLPTHLPSLEETPLLQLRSIPHAGDQEEEEVVGGGGTFGYSTP